MTKNLLTVNHKSSSIEDQEPKKKHKISPSRHKRSISPSKSLFIHHDDKDETIKKLTEENIYLMKEVNQLRDDYSYLK